MADPLEDLQTAVERGEGVNFVPCLKWVRRGVAKSDPDKVKLSPEELAAIIEQTGGALKDIELDEESEGDENADPKQEKMNGEDVNTKDNIDEKGEKDINKEYDMDNYDDDTKDGDGGLGIGSLVTFADPKLDPYLSMKRSASGNQNEDLESNSDIEDMKIKPTDNLVLVGHVEGNASILEVYVYNDVEDAFYVHHDVLLPSFPMALEWIGYSPEGEGGKQGNLVAVGSMGPVIDVWDIDLVDSLEPDFSLGTKAKKKKKIKGYGHKDAVLCLAWNRNAEHVLASGSVDQTVLLWDLNGATIASTIKAHKEKVQTLAWHPFEAQNLLTGCCDGYARLFDCTSENTYKQWKVDGEVEKVLWNHFNPFTFLVATDQGTVQLFDARQEDKPLWTLNAHNEGVNGMSLSTQCPDCLVTGSSDKTIKVWDISDDKPTCIQEQNLKLGTLHSLEGCPDAPFVMVAGGDKQDNNLKVFDIREYAAVRSRFGNRSLKNPLKYTDFGYTTANDAEVTENIDQNTSDSYNDLVNGTKSKDVEMSDKTDTFPKPDSGGAAKKFLKKTKKKKKQF